MNAALSALLVSRVLPVLIGLQACVHTQSTDEKNLANQSSLSSGKQTISICHAELPSRPVVIKGSQSIRLSYSGRVGMVQIAGGSFLMGAQDDQARADELPRHTVRVDAFWMDATEVTNAQFAKFIEATGYVTTAERKPNWQEIRKQLPLGTPKPDERLLVASSLVFVAPAHDVSLNDYHQWWQWIAGANWRHPEGPGSTIIGKNNHPVVQISWDDATAYANWAGKRLPTEAEWEWAARAGQRNSVYPWGNEPTHVGPSKANLWQGPFPAQNTPTDGFTATAPVKSFAPNDYGLYDMAGNVWEWCADYYRSDYYRQLIASGETDNPQGPSQSYDSDEPTIPKRVMRGGSFLCNDSYCSGYRLSARMKSSPDTGLSHTGFRCVQN